MPLFRFSLFLTFFLPLSGQETLIREVFDAKTDTHVEVLGLFTQPLPGGYFPVRVKIANNLRDDRSIRLNFEASTGYGNNGNKTRSEFSFNAPGGKSVTRDILVPLAPPASWSGGYMHLKTELSGSLGRAENISSSEILSSQPAVLLSEPLFTRNASTLDSEAETVFGGSRGGSAKFAAKFDPRQLPDDWRAFSGYDSVLMTDTDWTNIPPGGRNAILSWVRLGGQLAIFTESSATAASLGLPGDASFGEIVIRTIPSGATMNAPDTMTLVASRPGAIRHQSLNSDFNGSWPLQGKFGKQAYQYGLFIGVLILFGILVGPVNLFVLAKSGRRHRLFVTTPLISLGASLLLVGLIIFQDGFGGNGTRLVLMEVQGGGDQHSAFIHQEQISRTGVLVGSRFEVATPCVINPVAIAQDRWARYTGTYDTKGTFNLQADGSKFVATGDWFQSRSEHGHALSAVVPTRGRIESTEAPDTFFSTFEYPIDTLFYQDAEKQWHRAEAIVPGAKFKLVPVDFSMVDPALSEISNGFTSRNRNFFNSVKNRPGHFIAVTTAAPGIDTLPGIRWKETRTIITGPVVAR